MYTRFLKMFSIVLILIGAIFLLTIFGFKFFFYENNERDLVVLGPDNVLVYTVPSDQKGFNVKNLDIDILNNKESLNVYEKLRPLPVKPELLPIETNEENKIKKTKNITTVKKSITKIKDKGNNTFKDIKNKSNQTIGMYRVQFGSFRDLKKAEVAIDRMKKTHINLLADINLKVFSYTNNDSLTYHRVWTSSLKKRKALKLCDQFKLKKMVCILKVVR